MKHPSALNGPGPLRPAPEAPGDGPRGTAPADFGSQERAAAGELMPEGLDASLGPRTRSLFAQSGTRQRYARERTVLWQGDASTHAHLVLRGTARLVKQRSDGSGMPLSDLAPGDWIGLSETIAGVPYLSDAVVAPGAELWVVSQPALRRLAEERDFGGYLHRILALTACRLHVHLEARTPGEKLRSFLRLKAGLVGGPRIDLTQEQLAEAVGFTRETVNRHLKEMEATGILRVGRGGIMLLRAEALG